MPRTAVVVAVLVGLAALAAVASAAVSPTPVRLAPLRAPIAAPWFWTPADARVQRSVRRAATPFCFDVMLHVRDRAWLHKFAKEVSDPSSPIYRQYLSLDELAAHVAPDAAVVERVRAWLVGAGYADDELSFVPTRDSVHVCGSLHQAERALKVHLEPFTSTAFGEHPKLIWRSLTPERVPIDLHAAIQLVHGVSNFPVPPRHKAHRDRTTAPSAAATVDAAADQRALSIIQARGADSTMSLIFNLVCADGSAATGSAPCSGHGPAVNTAILIGGSYDNHHFYNTSGIPTCSAGTCSLSLPVVNYDPVVDVKMFVLFADGNNLNVTNKFMVIASPLLGPADVGAVYNVDQSLRVTDPRNSQAVAEFENQFYSDSDLQAYFKRFNVVDPGDVTVIGFNDQSQPGGEAALDIEWIMGMAPGAPTTFWSVKANPQPGVDDILIWTQQVNAASNPPAVHSVSYGMAEEQVDKLLGPNYVQRTDDELAKFVVRGLTVVFSAGDTGAGMLGVPPSGFDTCSTFHPDFPGGSPYVTVAGATYFTPWSQPECYNGTDCSSNPLGEVGVALDLGMRWTSGGGFSNVEPRPDYQQAAAAKYLASVPQPPSNMFNSKGRIYPDVAMVGHNLIVNLAGKFIPIDGTSASAPIFAGMITLLNQYLSDAGQSRLGFLNPLFYALAELHPEAFNDVVVGNNACGAYNMPLQCCAHGFNAAPGFDAVSGLGSPNFAVLQKLLLQL